MKNENFGSNPRASLISSKFRYSLIVSASLALIFCLSAPVRANTIPVFSTGVLNSGLVAPLGSADLHYQNVTSGTSPVFLSNPPNPAWIPNGTTYAWIDDTGRQSLGFDEFYQTTFSLSGLNSSLAVLNLSVAVDNNLLDVKLNGVSLGSSYRVSGGNVSNFQALNALPSITSGFLPGNNTLTFELQNNGPGGFLATLSGTAPPVGTATPEPGTLATLFTGLVTVVSWRRKKL